MRVGRLSSIFQADKTKRHVALRSWGSPFFNHLMGSKVRLGIQAVGQIRQGAIVVTVGLNVLMVVNGIPVLTPAGLQLDRHKPVSLAAQPKVTVTIQSFVRQTLLFMQWECQAPGEHKQVSTNLTILLTLTQNTACTAIYASQ